MKTLLLLRHAKSSRDDPALLDHDRPLNKRGKRDAPLMGRLLRETNLTPDLILSSTATRALSTAEAVAEASGYARGVTTSRDLYLAEPAGYLIALSAVPQTCQRVLLVGHNPTMERFLAQMTGTSEELPTAALALIELPIERWDELGPEIRGRLRQVWRPRELETS